MPLHPTGRRIDFVKVSALAAVLALSVLSGACDSPNRPDTLFVRPAPAGGLNYTISGAVTEMTNTGPMPIEGARVMVFATAQWVMTDAAGLYSIPGVKVSSGVVTVTKDGYVQANTPFSATADARLDIRIQRNAYYTLSGMAYEMTPAGRMPIAGVVLYCDGCGSPDGHTFVTTDADGLYSFSWVMPGTTYLQVMGKEGYRYVGPAPASLGVPITTVGDTRFDVEFVRR